MRKAGTLNVTCRSLKLRWNIQCFGSFMVQHCTSIVRNAISLDCMATLSFREPLSPLNREDCQQLGNMLAENQCSAESLGFYGCSFENSKFLFDAFRQNSTMKELTLKGVKISCRGDTSIFDSLLDSLPFNTSLESLVLSYIDGTDARNMLDMSKKIVLHSKTLKKLKVDDTYLDTSLKQELYLVVRKNFTLEYIQFGRQQLFPVICRLNKAGRQYLIDNEDASKAKCVEVLGKVKSNLNCSYFHLKEANPILFAGSGSCEGGSSGSKRDASDVSLPGRGKSSKIQTLPQECT